MENSLNLQDLMMALQGWDSFLKRKIHLIACGGTAMTIMGVKDSTKDIDFMVPDRKEYDYLVRTLEQLGYQSVSGYGWQRKGEAYRFDLMPGKRLHTTELLDDPLEEGRHTPIKELSHIYLGVLNDYDLIVSKLFRGAGVDLDDCISLAQAHKGTLNLNKLKGHFFEMLSFHSVGEDRVRGHWETFEKRLQKVDEHDT